MSALVPTDAAGAFRLAEMMATSKLVPTHLQRSPGDCLMVIEQAMRWGMSPFAVAQCTSVIQGKLMFEGKLVAAAVQTARVMEGRLHYEFSGDGEGRSVRAFGTLKGEAEPRDFVLALKDAKTANALWVKQPDQQLVYASTRGWARRHVPEVMLGVYAPEEMTEAAPFVGTTISGQAEPAAPIDTRAAINEAVPLSTGPTAAEKARAAADRLLSKIADCLDENAVHDIVGNAAIQRGRDIIKRDLPEADEEIAQAITRRFNDFVIPTGAVSTADLDEVVV